MCIVTLSSFILYMGLQKKKKSNTIDLLFVVFFGGGGGEEVAHILPVAKSNGNNY